VANQVLKALAIIVAVALAARGVWELLGPLLPSLVMLVVLASVVVLVMRGPRTRK
jgi:hypothetical protein